MRFASSLLVAMLLVVLLGLTGCGGSSSSSNSSNDNFGRPLCGEPAGHLNSDGIDEVAYGRGVFVGVGESFHFTPLAETSTDGICWKPQTIHISATTAQDTATFFNVVYGDAGFVARDANNQIYLSTDGADWSPIRHQPIPGMSLAEIDLEWDGSEYVIPVTDGFNLDEVFTSPDGETWTKVAPISLPPPHPPQGIVSYVKVAGVWYAVDGDGKIATSTDFLTWTQLSIPALAGHQVARLFYLDGHFMAVGHAGLILRSADGANWSQVSDDKVTTADLTGLAWNGSAYIAIGQTITTPLDALLYSQDGVTWRQSDFANLPPVSGKGMTVFTAITAAPHGAFVIIGNPSITSLDGIHWSVGAP